MVEKARKEVDRTIREYLLINLFMGISMGANAVISTLIGQRDHTRLLRGATGAP